MWLERNVIKVGVGLKREGKKKKGRGGGNPTRWPEKMVGGGTQFQLETINYTDVNKSYQGQGVP